MVCGAVICCFCAGRVRLQPKGRRGGSGLKMRHLQTDRSEWVGGHRALRGHPLLSLSLYFFTICHFTHIQYIPVQTSIMFPLPVITHHLVKMRKTCVPVCLYMFSWTYMVSFWSTRLAYLAVEECTVCFSLKEKSSVWE